MSQISYENERQVVRGKAATGQSRHGQSRQPKRVKRLLWHLLEMVLAMTAGMAVYHGLLSTVLAPTGYAAMTRAHPMFAFWMMVVSMTLPMVALMLCHKFTWRYCGEMTSAMLAPLAVLSVMVLCHLVPIQILRGASDPVMVLAMAGYALYRSGKHSLDARQHGCGEPEAVPAASGRLWGGLT